ncbi:hypothetical protein EMIT0P176_160041 [Pseudomonas sp. IT-P176]
MCFLVNLAFTQGREVTKRAESSSFAKGLLEPNEGSTVTIMTQDKSMVIFRVKILYAVKAPFYRAPRAFTGTKKGALQLERPFLLLHR